MDYDSQILPLVLKNERHRPDDAKMPAAHWRIHLLRRCAMKEEQDTHKGVLYAPEHLRVPERVAGRHSIVDDLQTKGRHASLMETHPKEKAEILMGYDI